MGQDYYDYGVHYGPQVASYGVNSWNTIDGLWNGTRVQQMPGGTIEVASADGTIITEGPDGRDITVSERTASLSGSGLTTEVASLTSSTFNPNSSGERTDGYTPDTPAGPDAGRSYTYKVGGLDAALT